MKIVDIGINGEGIAKENGKVIFIKNALIDEDVDIEILKNNKNFSFAKTIKINKKSLDREEPLCPYFGMCGGCQLQHLKYQKQLEFKQKLVQNTLKKIAGIEFDVSKVVPSKNVYNYRNKSAFLIEYKNDEMHIGMFKEGSHDIVDVEECKLAKDGINKILKATLEFFKENPIKDIRYLVVRQLNNEFLITLVANKNIEIKAYVEKLKSLDIRFSLNLNINKDKNKILSNRTINIYGENFIRLNEYDLKYKIDSLSFMQVNDYVKKKLYDQVALEIAEGEDVVDSYCGAGLLSAIISKKTKHVYGVEISKEAIKNANKLVVENNLQNITFICGDCKTELPKLLNNLEGDFTIILDPPRSGCDELVLNSILETKPEKVIYVSCNPITLAKDLRILTRDYNIKEVIPFDMFPQTSNVETFVVLKKIIK